MKYKVASKKSIGNGSINTVILKSEGKSYIGQALCSNEDYKAGKCSANFGLELAEGRAIVKYNKAKLKKLKRKEAIFLELWNEISDYKNFDESELAVRHLKKKLHTLQQEIDEQKEIIKFMEEVLEAKVNELDECN